MTKSLRFHGRSRQSRALAVYPTWSCKLGRQILNTIGSCAEKREIRSCNSALGAVTGVRNYQSVRFGSACSRVCILAVFLLYLNYDLSTTLTVGNMRDSTSEVVATNCVRDQSTGNGDAAWTGSRCRCDNRSHQIDKDGSGNQKEFHRTVIIHFRPHVKNCSILNSRKVPSWSSTSN